MKKYRIILLILFVGVLAWSIIRPSSLRNWFLESVPSIIAVALIALFDKRLRFSDLSFTMIIVYFALPFVNAHYGVANVPFGETLAKLMGSERNMYDRFVHFASGLLGFLPMREAFLSLTGHKKWWSYIVPFAFILALGALYEIGEMVAALINPSAGITFTGSQGDLFDAAKDLACAAVGGILAISIAAIIGTPKRKPIRK